MKTIGRTLIILLAALIVIGATVALANNGFLSNFSRFPDERGEFQRLDGGEFPGEGFRPERGPGRREGGDFGRGFNLLSWIKNLAIITLIVVGVVWIERLVTRQRLPRTVATSPKNGDDPKPPVAPDQSVSDENS